jgi:hypothetical protein
VACVDYRGVESLDRWCFGASSSASKFFYKKSIVRIRSPHFEWEKLPAAVEIFTELNMAREWDAVRVELEKMA